VSAPLVLAVNPGAGSTKLGLFRGEALVTERSERHPEAELAPFSRVADQLPLRARVVRAFLDGAGVRRGELAAVVGRGGLLKPVESGTFLVGEAMLRDAARAERGEHAANLGAPLAHTIAAEHGCPAFVVDPVSVDELDQVARVSGLAGVERKSLCHALNMRAVARRYAARTGRSLEALRLVVAHLGTGASLCALSDGRMVDVVNPQDEGPFSGDRAGGVPATALVDLCFAPGADARVLKKRLFGDGGLYSYLGTRDVREAAERAERGDRTASLVLDAMAYQVAKAVGEMAVALAGEVDAVLLTGGAAHVAPLVGAVRRRVEWIAPVSVHAGEDELGALAEGARRVLAGEEQARSY
jgi:butyrate kinase